jgi:deoxyribose-phosphate aldolase
MRQHCPASLQIKAAGGVRTLDDLLLVRSIGVSRIGATATQSILEEAKARGIGDIAAEVQIRKSCLGSGTR